MNAGSKNNEFMKTTGENNACAAFQDQLPELFESGANLKEQEHLKTCEQCSALVSDLEYIAQQAKLLLPIHDPSPVVWENIQTSLTSEKQNNGSSPTKMSQGPSGPAALPRRIVLTGFMGAGKSTVGRMLAARLRWPFLDIDS